MADMVNNKEKLIQDLNVLQKNLSKQEEIISQLNKLISDTNKNQFDWESNAEELYGFALQNEMALLKSRDLIIKTIGYLADQKRKKSFALKDKTLKESDIFLAKITDTVVYFRLPQLTPKYSSKQKRNESMLDYSVKNYIKKALLNYQNKHGYVDLWHDFTVVFIHHFKENDTFCDTDNLDIKKPIDGLLNVLIRDDGCKYSHIIQLSEMDAQKNYTEMYVYKGHQITNVIAQYLPNFE